jgi:hypothetical protein
MRSADALTSAPSFGGSHGNKNARFAILDCHSTPPKPISMKSLS